MVDIDEILAGAIRTAWLEISGPESRSPHHIEVETARRIRQALEREGIIITRSRPACVQGQLYALQNAERFCRKFSLWARKARDDELAYPASA